MRRAGRAALLTAALLAAALPAGAAEGTAVFRLCMACHAIARDTGQMTGPSLSAIVGRPAASVPGFAYSPAMRHSGIVWDEDTLDRFLADPRRVVPANRMAFPGVRRAEDRRALIDFLKQAPR